ncbi:hypothetical protein HON22_00255 [Candidatus Peregrinibacteria bacterium]|nr:hypothetical protein [Candidatus Peregrinibacteria bacterium]
MQKEQNYTILSMHSVGNLLGEQKIKNIAQTGKTLTTTENDILIALAKGFTETNYKGNEEPVPTNVNPHVKTLPKLRITRDELLKLMNVSRDNHFGIDQTMNALESLAQETLDFEYKRLCHDKHGLPIKTPKGTWKMETVKTKEPLLTVSWVYNEEKTRLRHIEITPATIFVDQIDSYYLSIPDQLIEKLRKLTGYKRVPVAIKYMFIFISQRLEFQRRNPKRSYTHTIGWQELAQIVRIPELSIKRKKGRVLDSLNKALETSQSLGLLKSWKLTEDIYTLKLSSWKVLKQIDKESSVEKTLSFEKENSIEDVPFSKLEYLSEWSFADGTKIAPNTLERWLKQRKMDEILLCIKLYEAQSSNVSPGKHEAYLQSLISKNAGVQKGNIPENEAFAREFKKRNQWKELEIHKGFVSVQRGGIDRETVCTTIDPSQFKNLLEHLYESHMSLQM